MGDEDNVFRNQMILSFKFEGKSINRCL